MHLDCEMEKVNTQGTGISTCNSADHDIFVSNLQCGEVLCYSVVLIKGGVTNKNNSLCVPQNCKIKQFNNFSGLSKTTQWPIINFRFKCLVELSLEENELVVECCGRTLELKLHYKPRKTSLSVIPLYIVCHGHDGKFQAPAGVENSIRSACERIALGAKLIQTVIAEKLYDCNFGRKTFQLETDIDPSAPDCVTFHSQLSHEKARKMNPHELWEHFGRELMMSSLGSNNRKFLAFLSCTRYNPPTDGTVPNTYTEMLSAMEAHVALGGGGLAIFGSACLYTWAKTVEDVLPYLTNQTKVDSKYFMDDSCYRGTYGSCFSTTLGSALHELGHTFDLGHSSDGIMGRGFDNIDLVFTVPKNDNENRTSSKTCAHIAKPVFRELSQNSTVCLTRLLQVSYTVTPLEEKLKQKQENINRRADFNSTENVHNAKLHGTDKKFASQSGNNFEKTNSLQNKKPNYTTEKLMDISDHTYWSKSCAALLSYHRWFNDYTDKFSGELVLDSVRNVIESSVGIRVVEIRDGSGQILCDWQFLEEKKVTEFALPSEVYSEAGQLLVAEDSAGNILKHPLPFYAVSASVP
ncbi:putative zinc metalloproteinase C607.06c [Schistocerca piceifrons]|uniref:putative zinc metalloproteinase C607.06c n=1 Tax=Schistocerca piceifrons TaxID=274613 RepID=UPI001F5EC520|nr:putative zinc metalloproteinase C607.06c [Schistocerca piceifrons]